ncbi:MAG: glycosyltransferase [Actinomycetota bacterium]|nr:glycosyltransferase [Actinomycetota bacterium]
MARYLAYTSPARGHLYPLVATLLELRRRGHEVHVRTLASEVAALDALGLHAGAIAAAIEELLLDDWRWSTPQEALAGGLRTFGERSVHELADLERAIAQVQPDVLLVDITTVGAAALAESVPIPWAQWIPFFQHFGLAPGASPREPTLVPFTLAPAGMEVLNAPRSRLGLPPLAAPAEAWRAPLYLYYTAEPFEAQGLRFPPSFRLVGPGLWEPAAQAPDWLGDLDEPLVLVTASSEFQRDERLLETALEALRSEDVRVVATTVAHDPGRFDPPANARIVRWLPHGPLVRKAACVVCHGGMGITQKALAAGAPVCVVPFGRDQSEVAERVTAARAGTRVLPGALTPASLRTAIRDAMSMGAGAQRVAAGFARAGGAPAAAEALESLLGAGSRAARDRRRSVEVASHGEAPPDSYQAGRAART